MGGYIKRDVPRVETIALNQKINKEIFDAFKDRCKAQGYPMNMLLETFMQQYADGRFNLRHDDILKWKGDDYVVETLNTTFSKEIYSKFKAACKSNGYFIKYVIVAFMEVYATGNLKLEYIWCDN